MTSYVRINLAGREPEGIVRPGEEYDRLCDDLCGALAAVTDADDRAVPPSRASCAATSSSAAAHDSLPDVCVVWADGSIGRFQLPGHGTVEGPRIDPRTGQHRHLGFMLGAGSRDRTSPEKKTTGTLLDIAPTALALLGVDQPPELQGRPIEAFTGADPLRKPARVAANACSPITSEQVQPRPEPPPGSRQRRAGRSCERSSRLAETGEQAGLDEQVSGPDS